MFSCEYYRIFKIISFEEHLRMAASIRCYFDTINLKQSDFCPNCSLKILSSERKCKNNLINRESQKNIFYNSHKYNVSVVLYYKILWFYQDFKSANLCFLNLYSVHAARILDLPLEVMLSSPKWEMKHLYNSKGFSFMPEQV